MSVLVACAEVVEIAPRAHQALEELLWELAADVGAFRRGGAAEWLCDRAAGRVDVCLNIVSPSAGELVRAGVDVDEACDMALERGERVRALTGQPW